MRDIKYRLYYAGLNKILDHDYCILVGHDPRTTKKINGKVCHWMQFTGLTDKSGLDIYEDDILSFSTREKIKQTGFVRFDSCSFLIDAKYQMFYSWIDYHNIEIIGNTHEKQTRFK